MSYESHKYYNGNLYASIAKVVKNQQLFMDLHAGITMDVKISYYYETYMRVLQWM
jgi:hypothetical protein